MKLIHCADVHLDSKMNTNLDKDKAKERKIELLKTFERMVSYALENDVEAVLIAGDLFDTKNISSTTGNAVYNLIVKNPGIDFYYLKGNHDNNDFFDSFDSVPENLKRFGTTWEYYERGNVVIAGLELDSSNSGNASLSLSLDPRKINIVMLHGQESAYESKDKAEVINIGAFKNAGIDYLALGHIHSYKKEKLDGRGVYCYSGCLEGRGFDECGEHGFVLLDVDELTGSIISRFIPFAGRRIYEVHADASGCETSAEIIEKTQMALAESGCDSSAMVKIILDGEVDVECEKDVDYILASFKDDYYFVKLYDETSLFIDINDYALDRSLKGEFIRIVLGEKELSKEDQNMIIRYGLQAIAGEEVR